MSTKRILLVDDEPHVIRILKLALSRAGYAVDDSGDGRKALEKVLASPPDVLICDIDMPHMNGIELCRNIIEKLPGRKFNILVLTARAEDELRGRLRTFGNIGFLEKPVSIKRLLEILERHFQPDIPGDDEACLSKR
jgi:CheY-like chemotaxis protein